MLTIPPVSERSLLLTSFKPSFEALLVLLPPSCLPLPSSGFLSPFPFIFYFLDLDLVTEFKIK